MAEPFQYHFTERLVDPTFLLDDEDAGTGPFVGDVINESIGAVSAIEQLRELPERNRNIVLDMAERMVREANRLTDSFEASGQENFWGLYVIGSRARGDARPDSDLDLLSVGTFYRNLSFLNLLESPDYLTRGTLLAGFDVELPDELPDEYNVGDVDRKYLVRATPHETGTLPVDLSVVDLTFGGEATLEVFKTKRDVEDGRQLPRVPLIELSVAQRPMVWTA